MLRVSTFQLTHTMYSTPDIQVLVHQFSASDHELCYITLAMLTLYYIKYNSITTFYIHRCVQGLYTVYAHPAHSVHICTYVNCETM